MSIIPYTSPETATAVRDNAELLNRQIDGALTKLTAPATQLVVEDPWLDRWYDVLDGRAESLLPVWSPETVALVAEFAARTGGAL
ncbi:hypothetical protein [Kitasatospora sp. NPDC057738]|uniref:hypothetical protein n=1 Tax=Kitasatospora sp. NPDC057738 TaxID=3346233 RepID=UPI0036C90D81